MGKRYLAVAGALLFLSTIAVGCAGMQKRDEVRLSTRDYEALKQDKASLAEQLQAAEEKLKAQKELHDKEKKAWMNEIEDAKKTVDLIQKQKEEAKTILLFDGKIKYDVESTAIMDYEETIILNMLNDAEFRVSMEKGGSAADMALISLLKEMSAGDRIITKQEIVEYRKRGAKTGKGPSSRD